MRVDPAGRRCACGGTGCLETRVGEEAIMRSYLERGGPACTMDDILRAVPSDEAARGALEEWHHWLGRGVASLVYLINPKQIVLGGSLAGKLDRLSQSLSKQLQAESVPNWPDIEIFESSFPSDGVAIGGASLAYQTLFQLDPLNIYDTADQDLQLSAGSM